MKPDLLPLLAFSLLSGCASQGEFPSLAPRPIEARTGPGGSAAAVVAPVSDAAALSRIAAAQGRAQASVPAFNEALAVAQAAVAKAGGMGSDSWGAAQAVLARLERTREPVQLALIALTEEQRLILFGPPSLDRPAVDAALVEVKRIEDAQLAAVAALQGQLNRR